MIKSMRFSFFKQFATFLVLTLLTSGAACSASEPAMTDPRAAAPSFKEDPIVFVHGCPVPDEIPLLNGSDTNYVTATIWKAMYDNFMERGYPAPQWDDSTPGTIPTSSRADETSSTPSRGSYLNILVLSGEGGACRSNIQHADELSAYVQQVLKATHAKRVDIVANSMGGLAARWYLKNGDGARYVRDLVLLAAVNHGTDVALVAEPNAAMFASPAYDAAREASPAYNCDPLLDKFQRELNGCEGVDEVVELITGEDAEDAEDETSVRVSWLNIYNPYWDELAQPTASACLNQRFPNDCSDTNVNVAYQVRDPADTRPQEQRNYSLTPHSDIRLDPPVWDMTYTHVTRRKHKAQ